MGDAAFFAQYMNNPIPDAQDRLLDLKQIRYVDRVPDGCYFFVYIDPAISMKDTACDTAIVCVARDWRGNYFIVDVMSGQFPPSETARYVYEFYNTYKPKQIAMETVAWQTVFKEHVEYIQRTEMGMQVPMAEIPRKPDEEKLRRIMGMQPLFQEKQVFLLAKGRGVDKAKDQLLRFSKKMIKRMRVDIVDALSDARLHSWCPPTPHKHQEWNISQHWSRMRRRSGQRVSNYSLPASGSF
jgi:predicted phage terminase large subunit-like protein